MDITRLTLTMLSSPYTHEEYRVEFEEDLRRERTFTAKVPFCDSAMVSKLNYFDGVFLQRFNALRLLN